MSFESCRQASLRIFPSPRASTGRGGKEFLNVLEAIQRARSMVFERIQNRNSNNIPHSCGFLYVKFSVEFEKNTQLFESYVRTVPQMLCKKRHKNTKCCFNFHFGSFQGPNKFSFGLFQRLQDHLEGLTNFFSIFSLEKGLKPQQLAKVWMVFAGVEG